MHGGQALWCHMVLAGQGDLPGDTLFQLIEAVRVQIQTVAVVTQFVTGFAQLNGGFFQQVINAADLVIHRSEFRQHLTRAVQHAVQIGVVTVG